MTQKEKNKNIQVTVTGGSGFIGSHCVIGLLNQGYRVKTTVRNLKRESEVRSFISNHAPSEKTNLTFVAANLLSDENWAEAVKGSTYVLHVASPFLSTLPKNAEEELYKPAKEGTLRVLKAAAREPKVKRAVLTSSMVAISYGHPQPLKESLLDEESWTNIEGDDVTPYIISKTVAEKAAWDFIKKEGKSLELVTMNPAAVLGPVLEKDFGTSAEIIKKLLDGSVPALPKMGFQIVDVRDVAAAHIKAMTLPKAAGKRFVLADKFLWFDEIAKILSKEFKPKGYKIPTLVIPHFMVKLFSIFDKKTRSILNELGIKRELKNDQMKNILGIDPIPAEESVLSTARALIEMGVIK